MKKFLKFFKQLIVSIASVFFLSTLIVVLLYRIVPVKIVPIMVYRLKMPKHDWEPIKNINPNVYYCALASEDPNFLKHHGFDFEAIKKAYDESKKYKRKLRGGSGISQQCAKNLFLLPVRSWVRKIFETYFTVMIETFWNKKRIMEVYLNIIEMGDGIYGIEAAAQSYYRKPASKLSLNEAAMIVSCFPNPRKFTPQKHPYWITSKQSMVMTFAGWMPRLNWDK
ncbi:MAG: monofunctional biosynthetic peptidoglycan transglycosylase [Bacteroidetes bacterium]|nr:monofunctional biosynthetic peptidoglycan transglycosylase [Bacteroidota bacterium]